MIRISAFLGFLIAWNLGIAQDLVITNARIIDGTGAIIEQGSVTVRDGQIVAVSEGSSDAQGVQIDAQGMTVMPGLINTHWHLLSGGTDEEISQQIEEVIAELLESILERGVTTIMAAGDAFPDILELRQKLADGEMRGPRLVSIGESLTAPDDWPTPLCRSSSASRAKCAAEVTTTEQARAVVRDLAAAGVDAVKVVYDDNLVPGVRIADDIVAAIADEARRNDLILFAHLSSSEVTALRLVELGVRGFVHAAMILGEDTQILRDLQIPVATTASNFISSEEWPKVSDPDFVPEAERLFSLTLSNIRRLWDEGVTIAFGTDSAARDSSLAKGRFLAEAQALNRVLSNEEVIATLTRNAAVFLGLGNQVGTLESGKIADIILIDGDPLADISDLENVEVVIQRGRIVVDNR